MEKTCRNCKILEECMQKVVCLPEHSLFQPKEISIEKRIEVLFSKTLNGLINLEQFKITIYDEILGLKTSCKTFQPSQMDLDALESMRTGRKVYGENTIGKKIDGIVCEIDRSDNPYLIGCYWLNTFTFEKPIEIPPKGTIVEVDLDGVWIARYSTGKMDGYRLCVSESSDMSCTVYYETWRIPE